MLGIPTHPLSNTHSLSPHPHHLPVITCLWFVPLRRRGWCWQQPGESYALWWTSVAMTTTGHTGLLSLPAQGDNVPQVNTPDQLQGIGLLVGGPESHAHRDWMPACSAEPSSTSNVPCPLPAR